MASSRHYFAWRMAEAARAQEQINYLRTMRKICRDSYNPMNLSNNEFKQRYRLSKDAFLFLCNEFRLLTDLKSTQRLSLETKVLTALFFFATGSYQRPIGVAKNISQKMCSVYIEEVTQALIHRNMLNKYIKFPATPEARQTISNGFYTKYGIPGILGCVDGSHFRIVTPPAAEEHLYFSRKQYHSMNVQMICDNEYRIINVNPKFGGANHDSFIWENSNANKKQKQNLHQTGEMVWLLGDSGYPQRPWLMTPYHNPLANSPEARYNNKHVLARVLIENTFGRLKNRWRCIGKDRVLHYKPAKCAQIITACCVLYNIALDFGVPEPEEVVGHDDGGQFQQQRDQQRDVSNDLIRGRAVRDQLVRRIIR